jgi:hypothetical protein
LIILTGPPAHWREKNGFWRKINGFWREKSEIWREFKIY